MAPFIQHKENSKDNIYEVLDQVIESGKPATFERKGKRLLISPVQAVSKLDRLEDHPDFISGDPEDIVHMDWSNTWEPNL